MAKKEQRRRGETDARQAARTYEPPKLREFGPVGVLTQGGTGTMLEGPMSQGSMSQMN